NRWPARSPQPATRAALEGSANRAGTRGREMPCRTLLRIQRRALDRSSSRRKAAGEDRSVRGSDRPPRAGLPRGRSISLRYAVRPVLGPVRASAGAREEQPFPVPAPRPGDLAAPRTPTTGRRSWETFLVDHTLVRLFFPAATTTEGKTPRPANPCRRED